MVDNDNDGLLGARQRWMEEGGEENDAGEALKLPFFHIPSSACRH